jgi:hypothetical protein
MKFVANGVKYEFDDDKVTFAEARAIEKVTSRTMAEVFRSGAEDVTTMQAMVWVAMKRQDASLRFSDLDDMAVGDIEWILDEPEGGDSSDPHEVRPEGVDPTAFAAYRMAVGDPIPVGDAEEASPPSE